MPAESTRPARRIAPTRAAGLAQRPVYIVDGARTPFLRARGEPGPFAAAELALAAGRHLLLRQPFAPEQLDEVILGCIMPAPEEANIARVVSLRMGCGERVPAWTVQRNCGSGMQAIDSGFRAIAEGRANLVLAGGTEAMSRAPLLWRPAMVQVLARLRAAKTPAQRIRALASLRPAHLKPLIALLRGLTDPIVGLSMGQTAEVLAERFNVSRTDMDGFALESHRRLTRAQDQGSLSEIVALYDRAGHVYPRDDGVRRDTDLTALGRLKPAFDPPFGQVTAGNSAQITDGAAWVLLASDEAIRRFGLSARVRIADSAWAGLDPAQMGLGPVYAMTPLLRRQRIALGRIDYFEINEAFAAQVLACLAAWRDRRFCREQLGLGGALGTVDRTRLNVDGGAIALGHPVGTSGARIVLHLMHVLEHRGGKRGIASLCIAGGQGGAMLLAR